MSQLVGQEWASVPMPGISRRWIPALLKYLTRQTMVGPLSDRELLRIAFPNG
jgi:hypothetical protein